MRGERGWRGQADPQAAGLFSGDLRDFNFSAQGLAQGGLHHDASEGQGHRVPGVCQTCAQYHRRSDRMQPIDIA